MQQVMCKSCDLLLKDLRLACCILFCNENEINGTYKSYFILRENPPPPSPSEGI